MLGPWKLGVALAEVNPKVGFCLMDNLPIDPDRAPPEPV